MIAYKFRSSAQIAFAFDIITKGRLYCSDWRGLNDPLEGLFGYSFHPHNYFEIQERIRNIIQYKLSYKICSLSETYKSHLLWAHYAGGFDGVAIEVELPDGDANIKRVEPRDIYAQVDLRQNVDANEEVKIDKTGIKLEKIKAFNALKTR